MTNLKNKSDVVETLQQTLARLDELGLNIAAIRVAEALEMLSVQSVVDRNNVDGH
jgi:hypothetical protein